MIGFKKFVFRFIIKRVVEEGWLSEYMFLMCVNGLYGRKIYFIGVYLSMCGKIFMVMIFWENIVGDDLIFILLVNGIVRGVNVEKGVFGII